MVTKSDARNAKVNWDAIEKATEVPRTYLVTDKFGRKFFKMYKPSEAQKIFKATDCSGEIVGILNRRH